jgi:hypothetical protein
MADDFPDARFSVATLDWARDEHTALSTPETRIDGERLRATALSHALESLAVRLRTRTRTFLKRLH